MPETGAIVTDRQGVYRTPPKGCDRLGCRIDWPHTHADLLSVTFESGGDDDA